MAILIINFSFGSLGEFIPIEVDIVYYSLLSNAKDPQLLINGVSQGQSGDGTNGVFVWKGVRLSPGENIISSTAEFDGHNLTDQCTWNLSLSSAK